MKSIETHARAFLALIILGIGTVITALKKIDQMNGGIFQRNFTFDAMIYNSQALFGIPITDLDFRLKLES